MTEEDGSIAAPYASRTSPSSSACWRKGSPCTSTGTPTRSSRRSIRWFSVSWTSEHDVDPDDLATVCHHQPPHRREEHHGHHRVARHGTPRGARPREGARPQPDAGRRRGAVRRPHGRRPHARQGGRTRPRARHGAVGNRAPRAPPPVDLLSILLLDPKQLSADELEAMLHDARYAHLADRLQSYVAKDHAEAGLRREAWMDDPTRGWPAPVGASRPGG